MSARPNRSSPIRRLLTALFGTLGGLAILLAVALGVFRLLVAQIPAYQTELKEWVAQELGLSVDFAALDARLGLTGPELTLSGTSIGSGREFLQAETATITLDPVALIFSRQVDISRLTLDGVLLIVERDGEGVFRLGDFALASGSEGLAGVLPQSVEVAIRDSELRYVDVARAEIWRFADLDIVIASAEGNYVANASVTPPPSLADRLQLGLTLSLPATAGDPVSWRASAQAQGLDVASLAMLLPLDRVWPLTGRGAASAELAWTDSGLSVLRLDVELDDLTLGEAAPYERFSLVADWRRAAAGEWRIELDDIDVRRNGRLWEPSGSAAFALETDDNGLRSVSLSSDFVRLGDLEPFVDLFPATQLAEQWALFEPVGDIRDLSFSLERHTGSLDYDLDAAFEGISVRQVGATPGIANASGSVRASEDSGTIEFGTTDFSLEWPALFREVMAGESLTGAVVWRQGRDTVQILSVDLAVGILGREARGSFDLKLPRDGGSATLDLSAELAAVDLVAAKRYLPTEIMPGPVVDWLDRAVTGGRARNIELTLFGPLDSFPFDAGDGQFRVAADIEDATLRYMDDWPEGSDVDGWIEFFNAGFHAGASGQSLGNRTDNFALSIPDLRRPVLGLSFDAQGSLEDVAAYLRSVPLIVERLGPGFDRLDVDGGSGSIGANLELPLMDRSAFELDAELAIAEGSLAVRGLTPGFTEINGLLTAGKDTVAAEGIDAVFVGGPVSVSLQDSDVPGYRAAIVFDGETSMSALTEAFGVPRIEFVDGQTLWQGRLLLPALDPLTTSLPRISIASNLTGVALRLPEPLAKPPSEPANLALDLRFAAGNRLEVSGNLGATRRFALGFSGVGDAFEFTRGAVAFGGDEPLLPVQTGILVSGHIETLELDRWLALGGMAGIGRAGSLFLGADVDVAGMHAFGQQLGETSLRVARESDDWRIDIDSEAIAGQIQVPRNQGRQRPVVASMSRAYLAAAGGGGLVNLDPRSLPGLRIEADEFGFGNRQLGEVTAVVDPAPDGLVLREFRSRTEHFATEITGSWLARGGGSRTTLEAGIESSDVASALAELGLDPAIEGESAAVTASVYFDSAPAADWLDHLNGNVQLNVETGTLREVNPGAGRVLGLMSIAALPRRLLLDFRDVFEDGFAFDEISGSFNLIDGNAYTNDLKFGGPAAEIGVVGRTGLRDRDYTQQIVVVPEPSNVLPTVGGLIGGAGVGAALLFFTRIFKEPLSGIGRASYCLTGGWETPAVEPIDEDEPSEAERCADLPPQMRTDIVDE